ncbi:ABC transporter substrate-binding protein [Actinoalloteichus caeruleus]|uniref:ABC transporter substrate-binding protein n=1 Tax=Actinoalloteichus cyanogriseus TaxID=2893586 RepID=UPI003BB90CE5
MGRRPLRRSPAAVALAVALSVGLTVGPAAVVAHGESTGPRPTSVTPTSGSAGYCPDANGVTVVIDFQELGGQTIIRCAHGDQATGHAALRNAGINITGTNRWGEAFICRIEGLPVPEAEPCIDTPPATAYWSYWHSPNGGAWEYSQWGVMNRKPPLGSFEGWSFSLNRTETTNPPPRVAPRRPAAPPPPPPAPDQPAPPPQEPEPEPERPVRPPAEQGGAHGGTEEAPSGAERTGTVFEFEPSPEPGSPSRSGTATPSGSTEPSSEPSAGAGATSSVAGASASPGPPGSPAGADPGYPDPLADRADTGASSGIPPATLLGLAAVVVIVAAGTATAVRRRRAEQHHP